MPVQLPEDKRVRDLAVRPPSLEGYGVLADENEESGNEPPRARAAEEDHHDEG